MRPEKTGVGAPLGDLEQTIMRHIWGCGTAGCQGTDVQRALDHEHPLALTTVLTTLERLLSKGILRREREGKAYRYFALLSEDDLQRRIVEGVMDKLIAQFPKAVAAYFAQQDTNPQGEGQEALLELARRVERADVRTGSDAIQEETDGS